MRLAWQFVVPPLTYRVRVLAGRPEQRTGPGERLLIGWSGMRGAVSLAAALAIPLEADGEPFPGRAVILVVTVAVILATLVLQATTLGAVLRRVRTTDRSEEERQERAARTALAEVALARLDELELSGEIPPGSGQPLRSVWEQARSRVVGQSREGEADLVALRLDLVRVQGEELDRRRREGRLPPDVARTLRAELDLQEVRLAQVPKA
jgi:NhaP-type Na+/H+ or K+/H+ antiporter